MSGRFPSVIEAANPIKVVSLLKRLNISVSPDFASRTNLEREYYTLAKGLPRELHRLSCGKTRISKCESPDFVMSFDDHSIGIEITELRSWFGGWAQAISEYENLDLRFIAHAEFEQSIPTRERLLKEMKTGGPAFQGNELEVAAIHSLGELLKKKELTRSSSGWNHSPEEWLFIYDNLGFPGLNVKWVCQQISTSDIVTEFDLIALVREDRNISVLER